MRTKDKLFMIWAIVLITCLLIAFGYWLGNKALPEKVLVEPIPVETTEEIVIEEPEEILFQFTTGGVLKDNFKPQLFLKVTDTDLSGCFIDGRLRIDLNGKIYWIRLER